MSIRLAEPVVYLKDVDFSGRHRTHNELSPPSMLRGILVLHLAKATKIRSVDIELTAKSTTHYPEGVLSIRLHCHISRRNLIIDHSTVFSPCRITCPRRQLVVGVGGARRVEVTEEHQLYSSSTVYFRQGSEGHPSRRAVSLGPTPSGARMEEGDTFSSDSDTDREDDEIPDSPHRNRNAPRGRRGASVDLRNFHRDVVSHHATTKIPSPPYYPSSDNTPQESPVSSAANLSATQPTPSPDQGSTSQPCPSSHIQPYALPLQRDQNFTTSGVNDDSIPCPPVPQRRASQVLEDFWRALRSDPSVASVRQTPSRVDTSAPASPTHSPPQRTPPSDTPSRRPDGVDGDTYGRRRSKSRFSLSVISDAIIDSVRSHSSLTTKKREEGTLLGPDAHNGERSGESSRGRSREKGKGKSRDLPHALVKVGEVFGLEPEEGWESRDGWKEFKKGTLFPGVLPQFLTAVARQGLTHTRYHFPSRPTLLHLWRARMVRSAGS